MGSAKADEGTRGTNSTKADKSQHRTHRHAHQKAKGKSRRPATAKIAGIPGRLGGLDDEPELAAGFSAVQFSSAPPSSTSDDTIAAAEDAASVNFDKAAAEGPKVRVYKSRKARHSSKSTSGGKHSSSSEATAKRKHADKKSAKSSKATEKRKVHSGNSREQRHSDV